MSSKNPRETRGRGSHTFCQQLQQQSNAIQSLPPPPPLSTSLPSPPPAPCAPSLKVEIGKGYTSVEWREDLKKILRRAAEGNSHAVFLFTDTQIKQENFLEDIGNLLNSGEVPNMFPIDERNEICDKMRQIDK